MDDRARLADISDERKSGRVNAFIGKSGIGSYHGKFSLDAFTHEKAIVKSSNSFDLKMKYPPYTPKKLDMIRKTMYK